MPAKADVSRKDDQVTESIRQEIATGVLSPGDRLGSARELAETYGTSPSTVYSALRYLTRLGFLRSGSARRYIVASPLPRVTLRLSGDSGSWEDEVRAQDRDPRTESGGVLIEIAPAGIASLLQAGPVPPVVTRETARYVGDAPYSVTRWYFPPDVVQGTDLMVPGGTRDPACVLAEAGTPVSFAGRVISRPAGEDGERRLGLPADAPVFVITAVGSGPDGRPVCIMVTTARADAHELAYESTPICESH
jgi:DNA-binding GntR family transcriptional regulator